MLAPSSILSLAFVVGTVFLSPCGALWADEHSPETATQKQKHAVTIRLHVDDNDVQWESDGGGDSADVEEVIELLHGMLEDPGKSHKQEKRIIVFREGDDASNDNEHGEHAAEIRKIIERVHQEAADHAKSHATDKKRQPRVMVFRGGDDDATHQAIIVGDEDDVQWNERVELGPGKVWIRKRNQVRDGDKSSYRLGIMLGEPVGVEILGTVEDSPAAKAGLRMGDLLLAVDGQPLREPSTLIGRVAAAGAADKPLRLLIVRDDFRQIQTVDVRPESLQREESEDDSPSDARDDGEAAEHEEHEEHAAEHEHEHARALDELREELDALRAKIKRLQRSLRDDG